MRGTYTLPKHLGNEPLVDAIFEMRFVGSGTEHVLPGYLYGKLDGDKVIEPLPAGAIPAAMRRGIPDFAFQPLFRLNWSHYMVLTGESVFGVACKLPYQGWNKFKDAILLVTNNVLEAGVVSEISRVSLKYVNLFDGDKVEELSAKLDANFTIGEVTAGSKPFQFQSVVEIDGVQNQLAVAAPATVMIAATSTTRQGLVITIDSNIQQTFQVAGFAKVLGDKLEELHSVNKRLFFNCLTEDAISTLEPRQ